MAENQVNRFPSTDVDEADEPLGTAGAVLVGLDGSGADEPVVDWAADEAARLDAPLRLVNVVDPGVQLTPYEALYAGAPSLAEEMDRDAHRVLGRAEARVRDRHPGLDVAVSVPWGPPAGALVRLSAGARRLVVGAPERGRLDRFLLGSVALPVTAHARCPVVVVPADAEVVPPRRILVGVDGSETSTRATEVAFESAEASGAAVTCVLGWNLEFDEGVVVTEPESERWKAVEQRYAARLHEAVDPIMARHPGVDVDLLVRHGSPARAVVEAGAELGADVVVVGSRGLGGFSGLLLGSVSRRVVQHAGRVVIVVR